MTCDFTSFSTVFPSYQDDGQVINEMLSAMDPHLQLKRSTPITVFPSYQDDGQVINAMLSAMEPH